MKMPSWMPSSSSLSAYKEKRDVINKAYTWKVATITPNLGTQVGYLTNMFSKYATKCGKD
jgi:hypothetical protein